MGVLGGVVIGCICDDILIVCDELIVMLKFGGVVL